MIWLDIVLNRRKSGENSGYQTPTCKQLKKNHSIKWVKARDVSSDQSPDHQCTEGQGKWTESPTFPFIVSKEEHAEVLQMQNWVLLLQCPEVEFRCVFQKETFYPSRKGPLRELLPYSVSIHFLSASTLKTLPQRRRRLDLWPRDIYQMPLRVGFIICKMGF